MFCRSDVHHRDGHGNYVGGGSAMRVGSLSWGGGNEPRLHVKGQKGSYLPVACNMEGRSTGGLVEVKKESKGR